MIKKTYDKKIYIMALNKESKMPKELLVSKIKFRPATPEDYDAVMDINRNIYNGMDYLPALYMSYVRDPNYRITLAEVDGEVVALSGRFIIDDGKSVIGIAVRVKTSHLKTGIWSHMKRRNRLGEIDPVYMNVDTLVIGSARWDLHKLLWRRGDDYQLRMVQHWFQLKMKSDALTSNLVPFVRPGLVTEAVSKAELLPMLENKDNQWRLFPQKKITLAGVYFNVMSSNFETVCKDSFKCVVTRDVSDADKTRCLSLSVVLTHVVAKGTKYIIDYFGSDLDDLYNHLCFHLQDIQRLSVHDGVHVYLILPSVLKIDDIKEHVINRMPWLDLFGTPYSIYIIDLPWSQM